MLYADDAPLDLYILGGVHISWDGWMILMSMAEFNLVSNMSMTVEDKQTNSKV